MLWIGGRGILLQNVKSRWIVVCCFFISAFLIGCQPEQSETMVVALSPTDSVATVHPGKEESLPAVLVEPAAATVNGEPVTLFELQQEAKRLTGDSDLSILDNSVKQRLLEGLLVRKAIRQQMMTNSSPTIIDKIEEETNAYRDKLFLKLYLLEQAKPNRVSDEMVLDYYQSNLDKFGGGEQHHYQMLYADVAPDQAEYSDIVSTIGKHKDDADLSQVFSLLRTKVSSIQFQKDVTNTAIFPNKLSGVMNRLNLNESAFTLVGGRPYLVRLVEITLLKPIALEQVSARIRRSLLSVQVRRSLANIKEDLLEKSSVTYGDIETLWQAKIEVLGSKNLVSKEVSNGHQD